MDTTVSIIGNEAQAIDTVKCALKVDHSDLNMNASEIMFTAGDNSTIQIDRSRLHGVQSPHLLASAKSLDLRITNSLLEDVSLDVFTTDTAPPGSKVLIAYTTLAYSAGFMLEQGCSVRANKTARIENSIIAAPNGPDVIQGTGCTFLSTLATPQGAAPSGVMAADPLFVDAANRDFHLMATSPAVDMASASTSNADSTVDLDGTQRPQGAASDLGAFELVP